jgi:hypothetical protein
VGGFSSAYLNVFLLMHGGMTPPLFPWCFFFFFFFGGGRFILYLLCHHFRAWECEVVVVSRNIYLAIKNAVPLFITVKNLHCFS